MSPDIRPNIETPKTPSGESLARETVYYARYALTQTYPILGTEPYAQRIPTPESVVFLPNDEIADVEKEERPTDDNLMYQALKLCGIPTTELDSAYLRSTRTPMYKSRKGPEFFAAEEFVDEMSHPNPLERANVAYIFGQTFMTTALGNAPSVRELPMHPWREVMREVLEGHILDAIERHNKPNKRKFTQAKRMLTSLLDTDIRIVARGTVVSVLIQDQTPETAEFYSGMSFNIGVANSLSRQARPRLFNALMSGINNSKMYARNKTPEELQAENTIRALEIPRPSRQFIDGNLIKVNLDNQQLIHYYLDSVIPLYYISNDRLSKLDPWSYPV